MAANRFFGLNRGGHLLDVAVIDTSPATTPTVTGKEIEIAINTTAFPNKADILLALENLSNFILQQPYP
jgi:hypothetical protein